ncbi:hypothetical protein EYC80_009865 [Monilinia laxa]|uniref:Uncharacterized protein n=1 Tax=Monilinia laxa TaxID=61186 RepID=A0A5N6JQW9_MONLA|nr:hypothetical protein EYC80_009865 [Monilinia laxa]
MSTSSQSRSSRRVNLETGVTNSPFQQKEAFPNPMNVQYYHHMVEIETNMGVTADTHRQTKAWVSKEELHGAQNQVGSGDSVMTTPCKGSRAYRDSMRKRYYHRIIESEKLTYFDPEKRVQTSFENLHLDSPETPRRVRFRDTDRKTFPQDAKAIQNPNNKRYYTRIEKSETDVRFQVKFKVDSMINEWSGGDPPISTKYPEIGDYAVADGKHNFHMHAVGTSDVAANFNNSTGEEVYRSTNDKDDEEDTMFTVGGHSFAIMSKSLREEESSFW